MRKRGPPPEWNSEIEIILRRWPHLPLHIRTTIVELVSQYGPPQGEIRFPTPPNSTWTDVEVVLMSPEHARITVGAVTQAYNFATIGLGDGRQSNRPRTEWRMLRTYAENPEPDAYFKLPRRSSLKVDISRFRRWLKGFFGIPGDPLRPFKPARWLPRFTIRADY